MVTETEKRILDVFREIFDNEELEIHDATTALDIPGWDSLAQVKLIIALEEAFEIKFSTHEIVAMTCVGDLEKSLYTKGIFA